MKLRLVSVLITATVLFTGCQTINPNVTPNLHRLQNTLADGVSQYCVIEGTKSQTGPANSVYDLKIAKDMSGWVRAKVRNIHLRLEGYVYYNDRLNSFRCAGNSLPSGVPKSWRPISEVEAGIILTGGSLPPSEVRTGTTNANRKVDLF